MWAVWRLDVRVCVCISIYIYPCICLCKHVYMYPCITGMYMSIHACLCMHVYGVECLYMDVLTGYIPVFLCMSVYGCCTRRTRLVSGVHSSSTGVGSQDMNSPLEIQLCQDVEHCFLLSDESDISLDSVVTCPVGYQQAWVTNCLNVTQVSHEAAS